MLYYGTLPYGTSSYYNRNRQREIFTSFKKYEVPGSVLAPSLFLFPPYFTRSMAERASVYRYSEPYKQSATLAKFSPDGKLIACAVAYRLIIRDTATLQIVQVSLALI